MNEEDKRQEALDELVEEAEALNLYGIITLKNGSTIELVDDETPSDTEDDQDLAEGC